MDASWDCSPALASNVVCGHVGRFTFSSPRYKVSENEPNIRITVRRTGGGVADAEVSYALTHITTSPSDVAAVAAYTTVQTLQFEAGVIEKSFLIPIFDDNDLEGDEVFQLSLRNPSKWSDVGNTREALVTIVDNDSQWHTQAKSSKLSVTDINAQARSIISIEIRAANLPGQARELVGELLYGLTMIGEASVRGRVLQCGKCVGGVYELKK